MKESSWKDCIDSFTARSITPDKEKAKSLVETAYERIQQLREVNEKTANFVFEDYYSSILEILHAIVIVEGFKIENHLCIGFYLRDVLKREDLFRFFDNCRFKRNSLVYYEKRMDFDTAKDAIDAAEKLLRELKKILKSKNL